MSIPSTRGSRHGVEKPWRPLAVLRPRRRRRVRTRPPSRLTRTGLPAKGPLGGTGRLRAAASAASRRRLLVSAVAVLVRTRLDTTHATPPPASPPPPPPELP